MYIYIYISLSLSLPVLVSPMGSWPSFCRHCALFTKSAFVKWWFSTFWGLRKMTTWYCNKMNIGIWHVVVWRAICFGTKRGWVLTCCFPKSKFPCYKMTFESKGLSTTETLKNHKMLFYPRKQPSYGAHCLPFCARNWNGDIYIYIYIWSYICNMQSNIMILWYQWSSYVTNCHNPVKSIILLGIYF